MANMQGLLGDPMFAMGAGILANNTGHYGAFGPAVGGGLLAGMQQNRQNQAMQIKQQEAELQKKLYQLKLQEADKPVQSLSKVTPSKYTPSSLQKFAATQNYADLVPSAPASSLPTGMRMGANGPEWVPGYIRGKEQMAGPGVQVYTGDNQGGINFMSPEEKARLGYSENQNPYYHKGKIVLPAEQSAANSKMGSFIGNMESSLAGIKTQLKGQDDFRGFAGSWKAIQISAASSGEGLWAAIAQGTSSPKQKKLVADYIEFIAASRGYSSGAAVPETEVQRDMGIYSPQINDPPEVIAYRIKKMDDRVANIKGMKNLTVQQRKEYADKQADIDEADIQAKLSIDPGNGKQYSPVLRENVSQSDIEFTAIQEGLTIEEVKSQLGIE